MANFDLSKLKKLNVSGLVSDIKSMINPAGGTPQVDPEDDLGLKIAEVTTLLTQMAHDQEEHAKHLRKVNELLNVAFQDIKKLRDEVHEIREKKVAEQSSEAAQPSHEPEKKTEDK